MLKSLSIKNYAIIDDLDINFENGFNVFTGETGAGKSIIVGALSFLIKGKADNSIIKSGEEKAIVEGVFELNETIKEKLNKADIEFENDLIVRRIISKNGNNSIKVNQCSVTLSFLNDLFDSVIDIHSQKDNQFLLNKKNHLSLLDQYVHNPSLYSSYQKLFDDYRKVLEEYNELNNNTYNEKDIDYIRYDYNEIINSGISVEEERQLIEKENKYKLSEKYIKTVQSALELYDGENGIKEKLSSLTKELNINDDSIINIKSSIESSYYQLEDDITKLKSIYDDFSNDDYNIDAIEERLYVYSKLKRKHNMDVNGILELKNNLEEKLKFFDNKGIVINEKIKQVNKAYQAANDVAKSISDARKKAALELERKVVKETGDLMLNNVKFKVAFSEEKMNVNGFDDVEFYISLNANEDLKPLRNVASGGEISRLMLALKSVFLELSDCKLVIFDEIDTGVSGKVALAMGEKMAKIAKNVQVLAITHLAPVAACASSHYYIYKDENTHIKKLNHVEIISELANISSTDTSENAMKAAIELYNNAQALINEN